MSMQEARIDFLYTINQRVRNVGRELPGANSPLVTLVEGQIKQHRAGERSTIASNKEISGIAETSDTVISRRLRRGLKPEDLSYRRKVIYHQTLAPRYFKTGSSRSREAQARGGLRAASPETRQRVARIGNLASRERLGPLVKDRLLSYFARLVE